MAEIIKRDPSMIVRRPQARDYMTDAFIYDHVRTPRGKGRPDGALHEITPLQLATQVLQGLRERSELDTRLVDDVVMGIVSPIGEQGSVLPRSAALNAGYGDGIPGVQVNRFREPAPCRLRMEREPLRALDRAGPRRDRRDRAGAR